MSWEREREWERESKNITIIIVIRFTFGYIVLNAFQEYSCALDTPHKYIHTRISITTTEIYSCPFVWTFGLLFNKRIIFSWSNTRWSVKNNTVFNAGDDAFIPRDYILCTKKDDRKTRKKKWVKAYALVYFVFKKKNILLYRRQSPIALLDRFHRVTCSVSRTTHCDNCGQLRRRYYIKIFLTSILATTTTVVYSHLQVPHSELRAPQKRRIRKELVVRVYFFFLFLSR